MPGELPRGDTRIQATPTAATDRRSSVTVIEPTSDDRWAALVTRRRSDVFHSPAWMRVLRQSYGFDVRAHVLLNADGVADAGYALVEVDDMVGRRSISLPFSDFCDPLVDELDQWVTLRGALARESHPLTVKVLFDEVAERDDVLDERGRSKWHRADTTVDADAMWQRLDSGARRAIRKSRAAGVQIRRAQSITDVRTFFDLHLRVRKSKYGLLAQPWVFFEALWDQFLRHDHGALLLAEHDGAAVGGALFLQWKETLYYKLNASDRDALAMRPNDAVLWQGLQLAHSSGLRWLDFGISAIDQEGLIRYKRKYATHEGEVRVLRSTPPTVDPRTDELRGLLPRLTALFVRDDVPDAVTREAGDLLYRYFV